MKTYLVTGCAGFIGSNFVHYMLEKYEDIRLVNLDKLTYAGNLENLQDIEGDARHIFVQGDICDKAPGHRPDREVRPRLCHQLCGREPRGPQHQEPRDLRREQRAGHREPAAVLPRTPGMTPPPRPGKRARNTCRCPPTRSTARWARRLLHGDAPRCAPTARTLPPRPAPTCSSMAFHDTYGMPMNITRCSNNYGPYQFPEKLIPLMINNAKHHKHAARLRRRHADPRLAVC